MGYELLKTSSRANGIKCLPEVSNGFTPIGEIDKELDALIYGVWEPESNTTKRLLQPHGFLGIGLLNSDVL
jgi:hypothetical protein